MPTQLSDFTAELRAFTGTPYVSILAGLQDKCKSTLTENPPDNTLCYTISGCLSTGNNCYYRNNSLLDINTVYQGANVTDISNILGRTNANITWGDIKAKQLSVTYRDAFDDAKIRAIQQDISDLNESLAKQSHNATYNEIVALQKENRSKRDNLDRKMQSVYETETLDVTMRYDNTVYTTLIWTVMTTSILYYLFIKL